MSKNKFRIFGSLTLLLMLACVSAKAQETIAINGGTIITGTGETIENGVVVIKDGRISAIGADIDIPVEAMVVDAKGKIVMPGFVEAHSSEAMSQANETNPNVPYVSVMDSIDPMRPYFDEARRNGVTSVAVVPGNTTMIGGQAAVIKTGGEFVEYMVLKRDAGMKLSMRPVGTGSRMGHLAALRKALKDAKDKLEKSKKKDGEDKKKDSDKNKDAGKKKAAKEKADAEKTKEGDASGRRGRRRGAGRRRGQRPDADKPDEKKDDSKKKDDSAKKDGDKKQEEDPVQKELERGILQLVAGELPAFIYCDNAVDVENALNLIKDFGLNPILVLGRDTHEAADMIAHSGHPVILDSTMVFWQRDERTLEDEKVVLTEVYRQAKVPFVFQVARASRNTLGNNYLWYQAATAVKYGMPKDEAMQALTSRPAKFLGVDKYVGTLEVGKDGDVIVLTGDPLKVDTWVDTTIVNGEVVYERSKDRTLSRLLGDSENE